MREPRIDDIVDVKHGWVAAVEAQLTSNGNLLGDVLKRLDALEHQARPLQEEFVPLTREQVNRNVEILAERDAARAALAKYGRHLHDCRVVGALPLPACTCGLTDALNASPT